MLKVQNIAIPQINILISSMDILAILVAAEISSRIRFDVSVLNGDPIYLILLCLACSVAIFLFPRFDIGKTVRGYSLSPMDVELMTYWGATIASSLIVSFIFHKVGEVSRLWIFYWFVVGLAMLLIYRKSFFFMLRRLRRTGRNLRPVVIIGYGLAGAELYRRATLNDWYGYEVKAVFAYRSDQVAPPSGLNVPIFKSISSLHAYIEHYGIREVWITLPICSPGAIKKLHAVLRNALVDIKWMPDIVSMHFLSSKSIKFLGMPAFDLNEAACTSHLTGLLKSLFDRLFSLFILVGLTPIFIVIASLIKVDSPGPVFFVQTRLGLNGRLFKMYKFRSMMLHDEGDKLVQATRNDPRVTRVGAFLRRFSLDELPQFLNVLKGDMSVVGPRPHAMQHNHQFERQLDIYMLRHRVKPGITGLAQVNGFRGETDTVDKIAKRVSYDMQYIQNWTLLLDLKIIVQTAIGGWLDRNAY